MIRFVSLLSLLSLSASSASAVKASSAPQPSPGPVAEACQIDVKTHCDNTESTAVPKCLHDHKKDLSPPCQAKITEQKRDKADFRSSSPVEKAGNLFQIPGQN